MISALMRTLGLFFGRELHLFGRALGFRPRLAGHLPRLLRRRRRRKPHGGHGTSRGRRSRRRLSRKALGASVSLLLHGCVGFVFYLLWVPQPEAIPARVEAITIRLVRPLPITRVKERQEPRPPPPKEEVPRPADEPGPDQEAPAIASEADVAEELAGAAVEASTAERLPRFEAPPLGLGTAPPQLIAKGASPRKGLASRLQGKAAEPRRKGP